MKKLLVFLLLVACSEKKSDGRFRQKSLMQNFKSRPNGILIDVRTEDEFNVGALPNAVNIVYDDSFTNKLDGFASGAQIFVYCAKEKRSEKAAEIMRSKGFIEV